MQVTQVKLKDLRPNQCRKRVDEAEQVARTASINAHGMQVPIICCREEDGLTILDGHMRCEAMKRLGKSEIDAIVLPERPSSAQFRILQLSLDVQKASLTAFERADLLQSIMDELKCTVTELAAHVQMKQPLVSKILPLADMSIELRELLKDVDQEKCYYIAKAPPDQQLDLAKQSGLTRSQLQAKARGIEPKSKSAVFTINGFTVTLRGRAFVLDDALAVLQAVIKELKHAEREALDISTIARVMADKAAAKS